MSALWYTLLVIGGTALAWKGSELLEATSQDLAAYYGLPAVVKGAVIVAIGSSFPELAAAVLATIVHGDFNLGVGVIVGSAIFNILVIPALSRRFSTEMIEVNRDIVYKEALFYMLAVSTTIIIFALSTIYYSGGNTLDGELTRTLALFPLALYALYVFIQYQDTSDYHVRPDREVSPWRAWAILLVSLVLIVVAVEGLVRAALGFGELFDTPGFLWGLTVVAIATSLPDAFVSIRAAREGRGLTSLANVLGSNTFDLLVAVPAGVLLAGTVSVNFGVAAPMMAFLTFATIVLFTALRTDLSLSYRESTVLLWVYVAFIAWMIAETLDLIHLVPGV